MNKTVKIVVALMIILLMFSTLSNLSFAATAKDSINILSTADGNGTVNTSFQNILGALIAVTRVIATGVAIIMLVVLAMKYMVSAPGDKADIKKHAVVYVVGAIILFAVSGILGIIAKFASVIS